MNTAPDRRITLADIAEKAGVHVTTVSLALRNHPRLPEATRRRIQDLARELGYVPDPYLRALVAYRGRVMEKRTTPVLAYVTNWNERLGWKQATAHGQFHAGAQAKAQELGYQLEHFWLGEPGMTQARLSQILLTRGINGVIIASHIPEFGDIVEFAWDKFSAVKIDYFPHQPKLHNVTNHQCEVVRLAMQKVVALGYRRPGFVMPEAWNLGVDGYWHTGYLSGQQLLDPAGRLPALLFPAMKNPRAMGGVEFVLEPGTFAAWFRANRPDVVIGKASFVLPQLERLGRRVPRDVAFVDLFIETPDGGIAGVRQNHAEVGALAVEILAGQLAHNKYGVPDYPTTTFVEGTWFDGKSCPARGARRATASRRDSKRRKVATA